MLPLSQNATHLLKTLQKYCARHTKRLPAPYSDTWKCHKVPCLPGATFETSKGPRFPALPISTALTTSSRTLASSCGREPFTMQSGTSCWSFSDFETTKQINYATQKLILPQKWWRFGMLSWGHQNFFAVHMCCVGRLRWGDGRGVVTVMSAHGFLGFRSSVIHLQKLTICSVAGVSHRENPPRTDEIPIPKPATIAMSTLSSYTWNKPSRIDRIQG